MKKVCLLLLLFLMLGCKDENIKVYNIEYGDRIYLYDLVKLDNITDDNYLIDSYTLGTKEIIVNYKENNQKKKLNAKINIVDTTPPLIYHSKKYYVEVGKSIDLVSKIMCGDNYDRSLVCKVEGEYDTNKLGEYNLVFTAVDSSNNSTREEFILVVREPVKKDNDTFSYDIKDFIKKYKTNETIIGIDVSSWQGDIDWIKVKNAGIDAAMIRIGYGYNKDKEIVIDKYFKDNLKEAKEAGIKVGLYFYSYAKSTNDAISHAKWIVDTLNGETLDLPIAFDWESWTSFDSYNLNFVDINLIAESFMDEIKKNGYEVMNYGSATYLKGIWKLDDYPTWLAHYTAQTSYANSYDIWQVTSQGKVDGIKGYVDLDVFYHLKSD